jgi:carbonic anhydrase/acetyltransferase-like protein (isoleucine patch superfamily)
MSIWRLGSAVPEIHPSAYVHPAAQVIGRVRVRAEASIWPGAVLRADFGEIDVGEGTSVQDNCIVHPSSGRPTSIGRDCVVGHGVHLEGVLIEDAVLVGSCSIVLGGAIVRTGGAIAAGALVLKGTEVRAQQRAQGVPAVLVAHEHDPEEVCMGAQHYRQLAARYADQLAQADGLRG